MAVGLGCPADSGEYGDQLLRLRNQGRSAVGFDDARLTDDLQPIQRLIGLFLNNPDLRDEVRTRSSPAGRSVIGANRGASPEKLVPKGPRYSVPRHAANESDDLQGERFSPALQRLTVHHVLSSHPNPRVSSEKFEIRNSKSEMVGRYGPV